MKSTEEDAAKKCFLGIMTPHLIMRTLVLFQQNESVISDRSAGLKGETQSLMMEAIINRSSRTVFENKDL